ncbi:MAG: restriction endonuclease subunit S [Treponema sp.]|nr:restriction endonuclease subunit S [Treponema sp.]
MAKKIDLPEPIIPNDSWKIVKLGDYVRILNGYPFDSGRFTNSSENTFPLIRIRDVVRGYTETFTDEDCPNEYKIKKDEILIGMDGDFNISRWKSDFGLLNQRVCKIKSASKDLDDNFLYYYLPIPLKQINDATPSVTVKHLSSNSLQQLHFPLPTLAEQKRIVNRIETMFAKLDEAKEKAQNVVDSFETRKAAILHKAFTGQLKIDNEELSIADWEEKKLGDIVNGFKYGVSDKCDYKNDGIPVLRIPNVGDGTIDFTDLKYSERNNIEENYIVKENDILIIRSNGSRELVGKSALYNNTDKQFSYGSFLIKITPSEVVNPKYLVTFLNSDDARNQMFNKAKSSSGIHNINTKELSEIKLKLPPLNYQLSIVNFLDSILEKESRAKEAAQTVLDQIALLKKSILARAFRGEL